MVVTTGVSVDEQQQIDLLTTARLSRPGFSGHRG